MKSKGKGTEHCNIKNHTVLVHMYHTEKVDTSEYFRAELSQFMLVKRREISQDIHKKGDKCEVEKSPQYFTI